MKLSARNQLKGKIVGLDKGAVNSVVKIDLGDNVFITSVITNQSVEDLNLDIGKEAYAVIKASDVMLGIDG